MEPNTEEQIAQRLAQLPADVRQAVLSADWEQKIQAIGEAHHLHIDQTGALGDLTLMTMLGMSVLTQYPARIAEELKVPQADAEAIAKEVNDGVFMPIRESMKSFTAERPAGAAPAAPVPAPSAPAPAAPVAPAAPKPDLSKADALLTATVVSAPNTPAPSPSPSTPAQSASAASEAPKPAAYAADPYREPPV